jgi:hypothetical protein
MTDWKVGSKYRTVCSACAVRAQVLILSGFTLTEEKCDACARISDLAFVKLSDAAPLVVTGRGMRIWQ